MKRMSILLLLLALGAAAACGADKPLVQPVPLAGESPFRYPLALWDSGIQGETLLLVHVTEAGRTDTVKVLKTSGRPAFDSAALAGAPRLRFVPGHRGGRRLAMWIKLPVRFARDTTGTPPASLQRTNTESGAPPRAEEKR
jgi:protein TonB